MTSKFNVPTYVKSVSELKLIYGNNPNVSHDILFNEKSPIKLLAEKLIIDNLEYTYTILYLLREACWGQYTDEPDDEMFEEILNRVRDYYMSTKNINGLLIYLSYKLSEGVVLDLFYDNEGILKSEYGYDILKLNNILKEVEINKSV